MTEPHVVKMANQISANVPDRSRVAEQTATHLRSFWAPVMIEELARCVIAQPDIVTPDVVAALVQLGKLETVND
jgi:hypothetical protein